MHNAWEDGAVKWGQQVFLTPKLLPKTGDEVTTQKPSD